MRMINADDLEQALREAGLMEVIKDDCSKCTSAWGVPIVDAEEVVRCKDCKHRDPEDHKCDSGALERAGCVFPVADDYFCSWGERREDENL